MLHPDTSVYCCVFVDGVCVKELDTLQTPHSATCWIQAEEGKRYSIVIVSCSSDYKDLLDARVYLDADQSPVARAIVPHKKRVDIEGRFNKSNEVQHFQFGRILWMVHQNVMERVGDKIPFPDGERSPGDDQAMSESDAASDESNDSSSGDERDNDVSSDIEITVGQDAASVEGDDVASSQASSESADEEEDDDAVMEEPNAKDLSSIYVELWKVKQGERRNDWDMDQVNRPTTVDEELVRQTGRVGGIDSTTILRSPSPTSEKSFESHEYDELEDDPYVSFHFNYASRESLEMQGIIPYVQPPGEEVTKDANMKRKRPFRELEESPQERPLIREPIRVPYDSPFFAPSAEQTQFPKLITSKQSHSRSRPTLFFSPNDPVAPFPARDGDHPRFTVSSTNTSVPRPESLDDAEEDDVEGESPLKKGRFRH
ncbi:hypothetical protein HDV00_004462 [Rhizophlyctis rosea]|nr:hypothetical protein HDV00_004462 [Rhizophlyctis rosea]